MANAPSASYVDTATFFIAHSRRSDSGARREGREREKIGGEKRETERGGNALTPIPTSLVFFSAHSLKQATFFIDSIVE